MMHTYKVNVRSIQFGFYLCIHDNFEFSYQYFVQHPVQHG